MADDSPFPPSSEPSESSEPEATPNAGAQLAQIIEAATGPALAEQRATVQMLAQQLQQTQAQLAAQQQRQSAPAPALNGADADQTWLNEFVAKPTEKLNAHLEAKFQELARQYIAPPLAGIAQTVAAQTLREQAYRVDNRFGDGTYQEVFRILAGMPENMRLQPDTVKRTMDALIGSDELAGELEKRSAAKVKAVNEANKRRPPSPLGTPGRSPVGPDTEIDDDDRVFQSVLKGAGITFSDEDLKLSKQMEPGMSLDEMLDAREKLKPARREKAA